MPKRKQRKKYKPPPLVRVIHGKKYMQLIDEHGRSRWHELPDPAKKEST